MKLSILLIIVITLLGFYIRTYKLQSVPAGFFADEAAIGYNAYTLLHTGRDEHGKFMPIFFQSFGDYRLPVPIYSNMPFVFLFGLNEFSIRLTAVFFGTLTIPVNFLLIKELLKNKKEAEFSGLAGATFLAISPWHIHFSRFGSEYIYFPFWLTLASFLFIKGLDNKKLLLFSFLSFGIAVYTYYPAIFTVPVLLLLLIIIFSSSLKKNTKTTIFGGLIFLTLLIPLFIGIKNQTVLTRWQKVSVLKEGTKVEQAAKITYAYFAHFSTKFLYKNGDIDYPGHFISRFSVRGLGELYLIQFPLIISGVLYLLMHNKIKQFFLLASWTLLYPLGSSVTGTDGGGPFAFRSIIGVIPFQLFSGIGLAWILLKIWGQTHYHISVKFMYTSFLLVAITFSLSDYLSRYFKEYPLYSSNYWGWQFGPRDVMKSFLANKNNYDELILVGNFNSPEIFINFYDPTNSCQNKCKVGNLDVINRDRRQLFAIGTDRLNEVPQNIRMQKLGSVDYPDKSTAFIIAEFY